MAERKRKRNASSLKTVQVSRKPALLWVNLSRKAGPAKDMEEFAKHFTVSLLTLGVDEQREKTATSYAAILFEYDFPDRAGLENLRKTKQQVPGVPILMLTEQHSEALAVWALRSRVFDYLVKPMSSKYIETLSEKLAEVTHLRDQNRETRRPLSYTDSLPFEVRISAYIANANKVKRAANFIEQNLADKIYCADLAELCGMNEKEFSQAFKKAYGTSFSRFQSEKRIEKAMQLLNHPDSSVLDVGYTVGFQDISYFCRTFKKLTGRTPTEFLANRETPHRELISLSLQETAKFSIM